MATTPDPIKRLQKCIRIDSLTPQQIRVEVAKDVLAALKARLLIPYSAYGRMRFNGCVQVGEDLRDNLAHLASPPTVCGIGALFVAYVARFDGVKVNNAYHTAYPKNREETTVHVEARDIIEQLDGVFDKDQLALIETAFECRFSHLSNLRWEALQKALDFGQQYPNNSEQMIAIMENIVKNKGTFVP